MYYERVVDFAYKAHKGQMRRGGEEEYFSHCFRVYKHLLNFGIPEHLAYIGLLHDVLEDTPWTLSEVSFHLRFLDSKVLDALVLLTREEGISKSDYLSRLYNSNNSLALVCKSMDALDNSIMSDIGKDFTTNTLGRDWKKDCNRYLKIHKKCLSLYLSLSN